MTLVKLDTAVLNPPLWVLDTTASVIQEWHVLSLIDTESYNIDLRICILSLSIDCYCWNCCIGCVIIIFWKCVEHIVLVIFWGVRVQIIIYMIFYTSHSSSKFGYSIISGFWEKLWIKLWFQSHLHLFPPSLQFPDGVNLSSLFSTVSFPGNVYVIIDMSVWILILIFMVIFRGSLPLPWCLPRCGFLFGFRSCGIPRSHLDWCGSISGILK